MPITLDGTAGITTPAISGDAIATQAEAETGTDNTKLMTPLRAAQSVSRFVPDVENRIINGAFDFWQRGTSFTGAGYGADRWRNNTSGGTVIQSQQAFTLGDTLGSNSPTFYLQQTVSGQTLTSEFALIQQRIESVRSYAGQTITILGWARRSSGTGNMAIDVLQNFGTGGSPSTAVTGTGQTVTLTSSWAAFAITIAVPSISGKTLGTNNDDYFAINFWTSAGSDFNARANSLGIQTIGVDLWGIHIKVGTHTAAATDRYRQPELGPELLRCQRYYQTIDSSNRLFRSGYVSSTETGNRESVLFPVQFRTIPSITLTSSDKINIATGPVASLIGDKSVAFGFVMTNGGAHFRYSVYYDADAEL